MRGAHAGHGRLFLCGGLWTGGWCGKILALEAAEGGEIKGVEAASGKKFGTEGHFQGIIVHGRDVEHYLLIDLLAGWQGIRYRSLF